MLFLAYNLQDMDSKTCKSCKEIKPIEDYYVQNSGDGRRCYCKKCYLAKIKDWQIANKDSLAEHKKRTRSKNRERYNAYKRKRRALQKQATPAWSQTKEIKEFYANTPKGKQGDHIYPMISDWVCGLHVIENLQYLTPKENNIKSNKRSDKYHK